MSDIVCDTPDTIAAFALLSLKSSIQLEGKGLRFRGGSRLALAKRKYNLKGNRDSVIAQLDAMLPR